MSIFWSGDTGPISNFFTTLTANNSGEAFLCEKKRTFYSRGVFQISIYTASARRIVARSFNMEEVQRLSARFWIIPGHT
jgi:hypothetical protein